MGSTRRLRRDWSAARAKLAGEGVCRVCGAEHPQAAHLIGRRHDTPSENGALRVEADDVVPLCERCHRAYDAHRLDLLPYLTRAEQARAVELVGLVAALRRLSGRRAA
jgi:hypothetical protein